ncbi:MAG TPA: gfo/Idh/MocA family oxidoreductase, partial [Puia sp.]
MKQHNDRRDFIRTTVLAGIGVALSSSTLPATSAAPIKIGIIGLDTEHSVAFTKTFNDPNAPADVSGFRVVAAYPHGSRDIASSLKMIPGFTEEMK